MKTILKWLLPSNKKLAKYAADAVQKSINDSKYNEQIAKYAGIADAATAIQKKLTEWLSDGKIDDIENGEIQELILPLISKIMKAI